VKNTAYYEMKIVFQGYFMLNNYFIGLKQAFHVWFNSSTGFLKYNLKPCT